VCVWCVCVYVCVCVSVCVCCVFVCVCVSECVCMCCVCICECVSSAAAVVWVLTPLNHSLNLSPWKPEMSVLLDVCCNGILRSVEC